jgi:hypothetical protein
MPGSKEITTKVISAILLVEPGRTFSVDWLMDRTGLTLPQVQTSLARLLHRPDFEQSIAVIQRGRLWRLDKHPGEGIVKATPKDDNLILLEVVEKAGPHVIARDAEGALYLLKKIGEAK